MADLELVGGAGVPPFADLIRCVERELGMREKVYPRWVAQGKLTEALAARELAMMGAVRARLVRAEAEHTVLSGLGVKHSIAHRHLQAMVEEAEKLVASQVGPAS
jgi:hypothetical protein